MFRKKSPNSIYYVTSLNHSLEAYVSDEPTTYVNEQLVNLYSSCFYFKNIFHVLVE